jgi:hypothetical protein
MDNTARIIDVKYYALLQASRNSRLWAAADNAVGNLTAVGVGAPRVPMGR